MEIGNIKFKAKKTLDGKWIKGDLVHHRDSDNVWITDYENQLTSPVNPSTVCQFTGLKDCKGNEIFEHDLIHFVGFTHTAEVIWSECNYSFMVVREKEHSYWLHDVIKVCRIERIGNKFDKEK